MMAGVRAFKVMCVLFCATLALASCVRVGDADDRRPSAIPVVQATPIDDEQGGDAIPAPDLTRTRCPDDAEPSRRCGLLVVPENRASGNGPIVEVAWARLEARSAGAAGVPLIVIPDGPGAPGLVEAADWSESPLLENRDVVLFDPRGTGLSFPNLDCGQIDPGPLDSELVESCRGLLDGIGVDLGAYHTAEIAADVVALADALQLARVDLLGIGHGARVATRIAGTTADRVRAVVLDSPLPGPVDVYDQMPLNAQSTINRLLDQCAQDDRCARRFGEGLRQDLIELVDTLDREARGRPGAVSGSDLIRAVGEGLRRTGGIRAVPRVLEAAMDDPDDALQILTDAIGEQSPPPEDRTVAPFSEGLLLSSDCVDEVPDSAAEIDGDGRGLSTVGSAVAGVVTAMIQACDVWDVRGIDGPDVDTDSTVALVLSGEFDPLVTPAWAATAGGEFDQAEIVQVAAAGHRLFDLDGCLLGVVEDFLTRPGAPVEDGCAGDRTVDFDRR